MKELRTRFAPSPTGYLHIGGLRTALYSYLYEYCGRNRIAAGINYFPMKQIVIKGEYSIGILKDIYNNEPAISLGIAYAGFFTR